MLYYQIKREFMQYLILKFFENTRNALLDLLANLLSYGAEATLIFPLIIIFYYCVDKKLATISGSSVPLALTTTNVIKSIMRIPRPFMVHQDLMPLRLGTATGYSFPSGHSTGAASSYPVFARAFRHRVPFIIFMLLPILIGLSRNYLGVHWPIDVVGGLCIGYFFSALLFPVFSRIYDDRNRCIRFFLSLSLVGLVLTIVYGILYLRSGDFLAYRDTLASCAVLFANSLGLAIERRKIGFRISGPIWRRVLNATLCLAGMLIIMMPKFPQHIDAIGVVIRYSISMLWISCIYPFIAVRIGLLERERA